MTLQELRYLVALADKGHFVRAAEACNVSQPTLSTQLKKLEEYLGVTLFERNKHQLRATPIGEQIIERARRALDVVEEIRDLAARDHDPMNGPLRLGVIPTLGPYLIPHLLPALRGSFERLHLYLREDLTANLLERLRQGSLDALLLALPVRGEDLTVMSLFREAFVVALPREHPLAVHGQISEKALAGENVLLLEEGHCMRDQALAIAAPPRRTSARSSRPPASRRCARWWPPAWGVPCCRRLRPSPAWARSTTGWCRSVPSRRPNRHAPSAWCGGIATRARRRSGAWPS